MFKFIVALFSKLTTWFRKAMQKGKAFLVKEIPLAIDVVEMVKNFVESPATPFITRLIPGNVDDVLAEKLKLYLPIALTQLHLVQDTAGLSNNELIQAVVARLREIPKADRKGKYLDLASMLSASLTDGNLSWAEIVALVQTAYEVKSGKK